MTTSLDNVKAYAGSMSSSTDRRMEDVRRNGWMLQLERALLANEFAGGNIGRQHAPADNRNEHDHAGNRRNAFPPDERPVEQGTPSTADPVQEAAQVSVHADATARADNPGYQTTSVAASAIPDGARSVTGGQQKRVQVPQPAPAPGAMQSLEPMASRFLNPVNVPLNALPYQMAAEENDTVLRTASARTEGGTSPRIQLQFRLQEGRFYDVEVQTQLDSFDEEDEATAAREADESQGRETYARRKLHLVRSDGGVQAWIRDADAAEFDMHSIACALNDELKTMGLKLTALTLNGRRLTHLFHDGQGDGQSGEGDVALLEGDVTDHRLQLRRNFTVKGGYSNGD